MIYYSFFAVVLTVVIISTYVASSSLFYGYHCFLVLIYYSFFAVVLTVVINTSVAIFACLLAQ